MNRVFILIIAVLTLMVSCGPEVQINPATDIDNPLLFKVEFDGEEFVADVATANIHNGVITITADKHDTFEKIIITLNADTLGSYSFTPNANIGEISYKKAFDPIFKNKKNVLSGRVDITEINTVLNTLSGDFSFIGSRFLQQFDILGNPIKNINNELVFVEETKIFTNGLFENVEFTTNAITTTTTNMFSVKADHTNNAIDDGTEYMEYEIFAHKKDIGANNYITIKAKRAGFETITLKIPGTAVANNYEVKPLFVTGSEIIGTYIYDEVNYYTAVNQPTDLLIIESHNQVQNKIKGRFNFDATHAVTGDVLHFYDGTFDIIYTEE